MNVLSTLTALFNNLADNVTGGSEDIKIKMKAKFLICLIAFSIFNYLLSLFFPVNLDMINSKLGIFSLLLELKFIKSHFSGYIIAVYCLIWHGFLCNSTEDTLKTSVYLAICPTLGCVVVSGRKFEMMLLFWFLILMKFLRASPLNLEELQRSHEKAYWSLILTSIMSYVGSQLIHSSIEKDACRIQQQNQELKYLNNELLESKERTLRYSEELKHTVQKLETSNKALEQAVNAKRNFITKVSDELRNPINSIIGNLELLEDAQFEDKGVREKLVSIKWSADLLLQMANNIIDASKIQLGAIEINKKKSSVQKMCESLWALNCQKLKQKRVRGQLYLSKNVPKYLVLDEEKVLEVCHNMLTNSVKFTEKGNIKIIVSWHPRLSSMPTKLSSHYENIFSLRPFCETVQATVNAADNFTLLDISEKPLYKIIEETAETAEDKSSARSSAALEDVLETCDTSKINLVPVFTHDTKKDYFVLDTGKSVFGPGCEDYSPVNIAQKGDLKIEIIDSGCGMDSSIFPWLYKSIFHTDSRLTQQLGGKGLGIYVSTELVRLMDGEIRYYTRKGVGTSIIIRIPSEMPSQFQTSKSFLKSLSSMTLDMKKFALVVDDEKMNREILTSYLKKLNIFAIHAENGAEAVEIYKQKPEGYFSFITMDLQMPIMNGIEACKHIRALETLQRRKERVKIVVITANCTEQDKDEVMNPMKTCRADFFFRKPLTMIDCQNFVQELLSKKNSTSL